MMMLADSCEAGDDWSDCLEIEGFHSVCLDSVVVEAYFLVAVAIAVRAVVVAVTVTAADPYSCVEHSDPSTTAKPLLQPQLRLP